MNRLEELFKSRGRKLIFSDGAIGTLLAERTGSPGRAPEEFNLENPEAVASVHQDYVKAGSDIITTNTFGAGRLKLKRLGLEDRDGEIISAAVRAALEAGKSAGKPVLVAGSIGPSGVLPPPLGEIPAEEISAHFSRQAGLLAECGADLFLLETMSSSAEARLALEAARETAGLPFILSFSFSLGKRGPRNLMGESPSDIAGAFTGEVACLGANCGEGPEEMPVIISEFRGATVLPLWMKPNAGRPRVENNHTVFPLDPAGFASFLPDMLNAGARIIGGCCGTGPDYIRALKEKSGQNRP